MMMLQCNSSYEDEKNEDRCQKLFLVSLTIVSAHELQLIRAS